MLYPKAKFEKHIFIWHMFGRCLGSWEVSGRLLGIFGKLLGDVFEVFRTLLRHARKVLEGFGDIWGTFLGDFAKVFGHDFGREVLGDFDSFGGYFGRYLNSLI